MIGPNKVASQGDKKAFIIGKTSKPNFNSGSGLTWVFVLFILVLMFGAGGYIYFKNKQVTEKKAQTWNFRINDSEKLVNESLSNIDPDGLEANQ